MIAAAGEDKAEERESMNRPRRASVYSQQSAVDVVGETRDQTDEHIQKLENFLNGAMLPQSFPQL